jgi:hypothetical protein
MCQKNHKGKISDEEFGILQFGILKTNKTGCSCHPRREQRPASNFTVENRLSNQGQSGSADQKILPRKVVFLARLMQITYSNPTLIIALALRTRRTPSKRENSSSAN